VSVTVGQLHDTFQSVGSLSHTSLPSLGWFGLLLLLIRLTHSLLVTLDQMLWMEGTGKHLDVRSDCGWASVRSAHIKWHQQGDGHQHGGAKNGAAENGRPEYGRPKKNTGWKMADMKMADLR